MMASERATKVTEAKAVVPFKWMTCRAAKWRAGALLVAILARMSVAQAPRESDVEAAYLFNFAKFMHAPVHASDSFTIGVLGKDPFGATLERITEHEQVDGRTLKVVNVTTPVQARNCDILFIGDSETERVDRDLEMVQGAGVLTVSSMPDFIDQGGIIQFVVQSNRVRFSVNLGAAARSQITLSSELLKVALSVKESATGVRR